MPKELKVIIVGDASNLNKSFSDASSGAQSFGQKMEKVGGQITRVGKRLTLGVTTPLVAAGVASFKMAEDFDQSMHRVIGLAGQSQDQVDKWSKDLIRLGPELGKGPRELAEALYFTASAGIQTSKVLGVVRLSAKASAAGLGETQTVADAVTSAMNAYGAANLSAAQAADVLTATVREGKGEAASFAPVIGNVSSFASQLGVSFNEVGAALASMTRLGTDAQTAATQLQGLFSNLVRPTKQTSDALHELGTNSQEVVDSLQKKGLLATLQDLKARADGNTKALIPLFGNVRALRAVFALVGSQGEVVNGVFKRMGESTGSLAKAFGEAQKTTQFTMDKFKASVEAAGIAIGTILAPIVEKVAVFLTKMSIAFQNLDPQTQKLIIAGAAIAAALGPVLIVVGSLVGAIGALIPIFAALASPIGLVVVALVALGVALAAAVLWPDKLQKALERMGLSAKDSKEIVEDLRLAFQDIRAVVQAVMPAIQAIVVPALKVIQGILMIVSGILRGDFSEAWKGVKIVVANELKFMLALLTAMPRIVLGVAIKIGAAILTGIGNGLKALPGEVRKAMAALPGILASIASQAVAWAAQIGLAITRGILNGMGNLFSAVKDKIIGGVQGAIDGAMGIFGHSPQEVIGVALVDGIIRGWNLKSAGIENAITTKVNAAIDAAQAAIVSRQGAFASAFDALLQNALSAFDKVTDEFQTRTEKKIARQDEARAKQQRRQALADANAAIAAAQALTPSEGEDPAAFITRQNEALKAAMQQRSDALFEIQRAADEKRAAQERAAYDNSRELQRKHFEDQLGRLEQQLEKGRISAAQFRNRVLGLFEKFDVPFRNAGKVLGSALQEGLQESFADAAKAARKLIEAIAEQVKKIEIVVNVTLRPSGPAEHRAGGGPVRAGSPYIVGEKGPELFIPSMAGRIQPSMAMGGGGSMAEVTVPVYIDSTKVAEVVRRQYLRFEKRNGRSAL